MRRTLPLLLLAACSGGIGSPQTVDAPGSTPDGRTSIDAALGPDGPVLPQGPSSSRFTKRPQGTTAATVGYWEYLPPDFTPGTSPLIVFLHGIGENDNDPNLDSNAELDEVHRTGIPRYLNDDSWPNSRPFVVLSPQHPGGGCPGPQEIRDFLAFAVARYQPDTTRVYLTGLSCGAIGAWDYLGTFADDSLIAAMVPIAGNGNGAWGAQGCDLAKTPIWALHGDADGVVNVSGTTTPMNNLAACPEPPALERRMTIYPQVDHDSWSRTYSLSAGNDIYAWMLTKTR